MAKWDVKADPMTPADVAKALEGVTPGPWVYRPSEYDDWGTVKAGNFYLCKVRDPDRYTMEHLNQARIAKVDPWEANARFIAWCREGVPALAAELATMTARAKSAKALVADLTAKLKWAHDNLWEINPNNYDHDDVCKLNDASVNVILEIAPMIGETHGKSSEWWDARAALKAGGA